MYVYYRVHAMELQKNMHVIW